VYEYNHRDKQLVVTTIPEEMRGQSIVDGPLPFLFGADANKLMNRYWLRTKQSAEAEIWLEAYPRWQADAANYDFVDVMLDRKTMQPKAIQVHLPGGQQRHVYMFKEPKVNESNLGTWFTGLFSAPRTPLGWTKVNADNAPAGPQAAKPPASVQR
jgi:TIGR03009 family protein